MLLRPGNAGSNTAADHVTVIDRSPRADPRRAARDDRDPDPGRFGRRDARDRRSLPPVRSAVLLRLRTDRAGPRRDPPHPRRCLGPGALDQDGSERDNGQVVELTDHVDLCILAGGLAGDRPPRASAPRRATVVHRPRRIPLPSDPDRPDRPRHRRPGASSPPTRPRRGPHPRRQGHRPGQAPVQSVRDERGVGRDRDARARPDRLDPSPLPRRRARRTPNRNGCATGCCTSPPGSRSPDAKPSCTSPRPGRGPTALKAAFEKLNTLPAATG